MKNSKFVDISAICQVIGVVYTNPRILEQEDKYRFNPQDFCDNFHQTVFSSIYNIWQLGAKQITINAIEDYLATRPKQQAEYKVHNGAEYILKCAENANINTFQYYYNRMKKFSLLRAYEDIGMKDLAWVYDPDELSTKKREAQEEWFDNATLGEICDKINEQIDSIKMVYAYNMEDRGVQIGLGVFDLINSYKEAPALGYPLYGSYINTVTRGARLGKLFLRSAATGVGKTRTMIADACFIGCSQMYSTKERKWVPIGACQSVLYIATEQDLQECQSMCLAFLSGVDEEHILKGEYYAEEEERVIKAGQILSQSKIRFECMPDFSMSDIENIIKKNIREFHTQYVFFDYIHSSATILTEVGGKSGVKNLREDNVLFLLASKLKDIAVQYGVFILSSTQLNTTYTDTDTPDQNCLRGSKAIADRIDWGSIMMDVTSNDLDKIKPFCIKNNLAIPNVKMSVYKNRQGRWKSVYMWMVADKATCRFETIFVTDFMYQMLEIEDIKIKVEEESIF